MDINLNKKMFNKVFLPYFAKPQRHQIIYGGSSSGKSFQMLTFAILWMLQGQSVLIARKTATSMRKSVWLELQKALSRLGVEHMVKVWRSDLSFESLVSKGSITLVGLDDVERLKSITPLKDNSFNVCIVEEATEIAEFDYQQLLIRQRGLSDFPKRMILLFNPIYRQHWIYRMFFEGVVEPTATTYEDEGITILKTTYKDNEFLGEEEKKSLEDLVYTSPYHYQVYCLGNFGVLGARVFENWLVEEFNIDDIECDIHCGMDFGFVNDPTTVIYSKFDRDAKRIYIYKEEYGMGWTNDKIYEIMKPSLYYNAQPNTVVLADAAEPKSIKDLSTKGLNVRPAKKGKDSIRKGLDFLKQYKIIVHPDCTHIIDEFNQYTWKQRDGEPINEPIGKFNHCIDALRYSYSIESSAGGKLSFSNINLRRKR